MKFSIGFAGSRLESEWKEAIRDAVVLKSDEVAEILHFSKVLAECDAATVLYCISSFLERYALKALEAEYPEAIDAFEREEFNFVVFVDDEEITNEKDE